MDYSELITLIERAKQLHRITRDPMLPSAIAVLTKFMNAEDPDNIVLVGQAVYARNCIEAMQEAREILYG